MSFGKQIEDIFLSQEKYYVGMSFLCIYASFSDTDESEDEDVFDHSPVLIKSLGRLVLHVGDTLNYQVK